MLDDALQYARENREDALEDLKALLRIPSVSTLPEHKGDMLAAAEWLAEKLRGLGFDKVAVMPTGGHPVVFGEHLAAGASAPTILFYGHYDVQPADPLDLWETDPFDPTVRGENLFARGASDMKGQVLAHLKAVEAMLTTSGLPVNVKYMIEGEEEIASPNLENYIRANASLLAADFCLNGDGGILAPDVPAITYGLRGMAYFELTVHGPAKDLHSGTFGGAVANPANVLAALIAGMKDDQGRITLPGYYDDVRPLTDAERQAMAELPQGEAWWLEQTGAPALAGEQGFTSTERATARPTLDVNGLLSGFTGEGPKTVLPAKAMAKVSSRLVPDQTPDAVYRSMMAYLEASAPPSVTWELRRLAQASPAIMDQDSDTVRAAQRAMHAVWGVEPRFKREGGTVPVVSTIQDALGLKSLVMGFGLPDDNLHSPNEKFHLPNLYHGIDTFIRFSYEVAGV